MDKITVAIADGHQLMREAMVFVLKRDERFIVIAEASNGKEAVEAAGKLQPQIILLDVIMVPVDGFEATALIRIVSPRTKIIGLSAYADIRTIKRMMDCGAHGYITKGSPKDEIINGIMEVYNGNIYIAKEIKRF